jgi:hypothetical protein
MQNTRPELVYGFFCEFVRVEASGQITPIGIWGEACRFQTKPPLVFPALSFHAFLRNPGKKPYKAKLRLTIPGQAVPVEVEAPVIGSADHTSQNLVFNFAGVPIAGPGEIVASIHIDCEPPIEQEFRLKIEFQPQAAPAVH